MNERRVRKSWPWWSTTRWSVLLFTLTEVWRLAHSAIGTATWPEAFICFCILFALPIDGALSKAPAESVVRAVTGMFGKPAEAAGWFSSQAMEYGTRAVDDPSVPTGSAQVEP
jgi:hypothetical protein